MTDPSVAAGLARMQGWVDAFPDQLEAAWKTVESGGWSGGTAAAGPILLGGMGGSAMAGHLAAALLRAELADPCLVQSGPILPAWVGSTTLAILSSYSGETWEAIALLRAAAGRAGTLRVITSGGEMRREAEARGIPWFELPGGYQPRAALGWLFVPCLAALIARTRSSCERWGDDLRRGVALLREEIARWNAGEAFPGRDPFELARELENRFVALLAPSELAEPIALRWKNQILENAEQAAVTVIFPEAAHNEIMGWRSLVESTPAAFVLLDGGCAASDPRGRTGEAAAEELARLGARLLRVAARGTSPLERMLSDVLLGDRVSVELARRRGVDPIPVEAITRLKQACRKER